MRTLKRGQRGDEDDVEERREPELVEPDLDERRLERGQRRAHDALQGHEPRADQRGLSTRIFTESGYRDTISAILVSKYF